ncbi:hypothetical protein, partial [Plasmodium yoelii yoelii]
MYIFFIADYFEFLNHRYIIY